MTSLKNKRHQRALLINAPSGLYRRDDRCQCKVEDQTVSVIFPPIEHAYAGAMMRRSGAEVRIRDYPALRQTWEDFIAELKEFQPDLLLFAATTATVELDLEAARVVREVAPDCLIVAKGEYLNYFGEELIEKHHEIDLILYGELEYTVEEIVEGTPLDEIKGILWRDDSGMAVRNEGRPFAEDLDNFPWPARDLIQNELYRSPENGRPITVIHANRGCPAKCIYCPAGVISGYNVRLRDPKLVVDEIEECVVAHGIRDFLFHGDTFTINKNWMIQLCREIIDRDLDVHWGCNSRVDTIDDERAEWMKKAGCWVVAFGLESGVQELLDKMKKGARVEKAYTAIDVCKRHGLCTHGFYVIGLPWETEETLEQTLQFAKEVDTEFFDFNIAYPLPGTELYEIAKEENLIEVDDLAESGYADAAMKTFALSPEYLTEWRRKALLEMNLRPGYVSRTLWRAAKTGCLPHYLKAGMKRLNRLVAA
jgi:radical SAM superfamily enzyme YgiQ (UPF0313 family)